MPLEVLLVFGLLAGIVTTAVGVGGGMILMIALSFFGDIETVLALTAPALLIGNLGRTLMLRRSVDSRVALAVGLGSLPGVAAGALLVFAVGEEVLRYSLGFGALAYVAIGLTKELRRVPVPQVSGGYPLLASAGLASGLMAASLGGGGLVVAPALRRERLEREAFVATAATVASMVQLAKVFGYGVVGMESHALLITGTVLAGALLVGNSLGRRLLDRMSGREFRFGLLAVVGAMAVAMLWGM